MSAPEKTSREAPAAASLAVGPSADEGTDEAEPPGSLIVGHIVQGGEWTAFGALDAAIEAAAQAVAAHPDVAAELPAEATVAFDTDAAVRSLNRQYRGQDKPTNVLSFPAPAPAETIGHGIAYLGDIVLAEETLLREAADLNIPPRDHLLHLVVHGLLHLMGYDHETDAEAASMEGMETAILATLGVADPYQEAPDGIPHGAQGHSTSPTDSI